MQPHFMHSESEAGDEASGLAELGSGTSSTVKAALVTTRSIRACQARTDLLMLSQSLPSKA